MKSIDTIIRDYTSGREDLEATNAALKEAGAGFGFRPGQNAITAEEAAQTVTGDTPADASGYGLLFTGTGTPEKVKVTGGKLEFPVNQVLEDGSVNSYAQVIIGGMCYNVKGDTLVDPEDGNG